MKRVLLLVTIVVAACLLAPPVWAENPESDEIQALRQELMELKGLLQSQQKQILEQEKRLQEQDFRVLGLEESVVEPTPYEEVGGMHVEEVIERVKAELTPAGDGFTIGGGKIRVTPYGFLRLDMAYDDSMTAHDSGNVVAIVFPENGQDDDDSFTTTATATRLGFNFDGPEFEGGKVRGKLEIDFDENGGGDKGGNVTAHRIRMRHAYGELVYPNWSLLAGQTWDVVAPRIPYQLDCMVMWGSGNVGYRRPQLRLTRWWDNNGSKITGQVSINHTDRTALDDFDGDGILDGADSGYPLGEARLGLDTEIFGERKLSLGISGAYGRKQAHSPTTGEKDELDVWLIALDGKVSVIPGLVTLQGEIFAGDSLNAFMGGVFQGIVDTPTGLDEIEAAGGFVHAMITPRKGLLFNIGAGVDDVDADNLVGGMTRNRTFFANTIYTIVPNFDVGFEIAYKETEWIGADEGDNIRLQTAFIYKF